MSTRIASVFRTGPRWLRTRPRWAASQWRTSLFYVLTAGFLAFLLLALNEPMRFTLLAWTPGYEFAIHRIHHVMIGSVLTLLVLGVAVQLYRPAERVGAYLLAAVIVGSIAVATLLGLGVAALAELAIFIVPLAVIGLVHPGLRSFRPSRATLDVRMLALAAVAAIPLLAFAALQTNLQATMTDEHAVFEHYAMMAGGALTIGLGALLASFRPAGWRVLAYGVALLAVLVGAASVTFAAPVQGPSFGVAGGILAILWAVGFVAVAEYGVRKRRQTDDTGRQTDDTGRQTDDTGRQTDDTGRQTDDTGV